jgi:alkanesulfonate monooxygenase SsuD/methylene tetrahydromethanopterin reductase-like flavin-dependent oxidoreductase (luciferase family)
VSNDIGLVPFWKRYDRELYLRAVQLADELGYHSFWLPEAWGYEAFSLLTEMACRTQRIRLGTGIINVFSRSPALIAQSVATLDEISGGRFILGIGTSGKRVIEGFHGRSFTKPLSQLRDVLCVVRTLLRGGTLDEAGATLRNYRKFALAMTPQRTDVPIYVAALKEKSISTIGELADGWIPTFWPYQELQRGRVWIASGAARVGRDVSAIKTAPFTTVLPMGLEAGGQKAKQLIAFYVAGMGDYYKELLSGFGYAAECDRIEALYRDPSTRAQAADAVSDAMVESLSIAGDPAHCVRELKRRRQYGIDLPIVQLPTDAPWPIVELFIRGLAP